MPSNCFEFAESQRGQLRTSISSVAELLSYLYLTLQQPLQIHWITRLRCWAVPNSNHENARSTFPLVTMWPERGPVASRGQVIQTQCWQKLAISTKLLYKMKRSIGFSRMTVSASDRLTGQQPNNRFLAEFQADSFELLCTRQRFLS
jgi:hypothetical protein